MKTITNEYIFLLREYSARDLELLKYKSPNDEPTVEELKEIEQEQERQTLLNIRKQKNKTKDLFCLLINRQEEQEEKSNIFFFGETEERKIFFDNKTKQFFEYPKQTEPAPRQSRDDLETETETQKQKDFLFFELQKAKHKLSKNRQYRKEFNSIKNEYKKFIKSLR